MDVCVIFIGKLCVCVLDEFETLLGKGTFGKVYKVSKNDKMYVMKILGYENESERANADREEDFFKKLKGSSPYIVEFIESFEEVLQM
jgi:serine/threonine protein kinase